MAGLGEVFDRFESGDLSKSPNIKDFNVFDFSYVPQSPLIRPETEKIAESLLRYHQTTIARNLVVIGPRGCGKTVTLRHLGKYFGERGVVLPFHVVNCRVHNTSFKVLAEILKVRPRGYAYSELCNQFEKEIPSPAVIVLDEAEMLADKNGRSDVLYFLSRSPKRYSVVLLTNNPRYLRSVDESIRSSLQAELVFFRNYSAQEILEILKDRAATGLHSCEPGLLEEVAAMTAKNTNGDVRVAIKTLLYCATSERKTVAECFNKAREDVVREVICNLNDKALLILKAVIEDQDKLVKPVYQRYVELSRHCNEDPYRYTQFYSSIGHLISLGLIMLASARLSRGITYRIEPLITQEDLDSVLSGRFN